jgi:amino acid transporter
MSEHLLKIAADFRRTGWISFWVQLVLAVISSFIIIFAVFSNSFSNADGTPNPGSGFGFFFAISGLFALYISTFWAFRYTTMGQQLRAANPAARPSRGEAMGLLRQGLMCNLVGLGLIVVGSQAIVGSLVAKSFQQGGAFFGDPKDLVQALDLFVVQANTNIVTAHLAGLLASLWLLNRVSR